MDEKQLSKREDDMLDKIWDELRYVRAKLDGHIDRNAQDFKEIKDDVAEVKTEIGGHKIKLGLIFTGIGSVLAAIVAWASNHVDKIGQ